MFLFYSLYFKLYSLSVLCIYYSTKRLYIHCDVLLQHYFFPPFAFLCLLLSTNKQYIFDFNPTNSSIATPPVSSFLFPLTYLFESTYYFDLVEQLLKSNIFFSLPKSSQTSSVLILYINLPVSVNNGFELLTYLFLIQS